MKPTINDVAKRAGVSKSTVSQFLNKRYSYMSEATRKRVAESIRELAYYPNQIAKSLKQKDTNVIAFICANLSSRFSLGLIASIEDYFQSVNYSVIIARTDDDPQKERELIESFMARQVDGIIVFPTAENKDYYANLKRQQMPIVFVDRILKNTGIPSVLLDNRCAGSIATNLLLDKGHVNIAILTFPVGDSITTRVERIQGYRDALSNNQVSVKKANIISCQLDDVKENLDKLMSRNDRPTALVATNDMLLEEVLMWTKDRKIGIPEVVSLVGIDDVSSAELFTPEITTLSQPIQEIGSKAAELLLQIIKDNESDVSTVYRYEPTINNRESIKKI